ncbi:MAG: sugar phosphate nucleotidyltransferase, partial [Coprobacillus sp.]
MKYIFLVAGKGTRLQPLTYNCPKSMFKLDKETTLIKRMITKIKRFDAKADIVVVTGFMHKEFEKELQEEATFVYNPFYSCTNSIASLWFARDHMKDVDNVVLIDGDIVMSDSLIENVVCKYVEKPFVLLDSSIKRNGDYNVEVSNDKVLVMSKDLTQY